MPFDPNSIDSVEEKKLIEQPQEEPGWFQPGSRSESFAKGFSDIGTLGQGERISSAINAGIDTLSGNGSYGDSYQQRLDEARNWKERALKEHPGYYMAGGAIAGVPQALSAGALTRGVTGIAANAKALAPVIAAEGTSYGVGNTEDLTNHPEDLLTNVPMGIGTTALGYGAGAALPKAIAWMAKKQSPQLNALKVAAPVLGYAATDKVKDNPDLLDKGVGVGLGLLASRYAGPALAKATGTPLFKGMNEGLDSFLAKQAPTASEQYQGAQPTSFNKIRQFTGAQKNADLGAQMEDFSSALKQNREVDTKTILDHLEDVPMMDDKTLGTYQYLLTSLKNKGGLSSETKESIDGALKKIDFYRADKGDVPLAVKGLRENLEKLSNNTDTNPLNRFGLNQLPGAKQFSKGNSALQRDLRMRYVNKDITEYGSGGKLPETSIANRELMNKILKSNLEENMPTKSEGSENGGNLATLLYDLFRR
jgi:hypothetical protein